MTHPSGSSAAPRPKKVAEQKGWRVVDGGDGDGKYPHPGYQVWYGPVLLGEGFGSEAAATEVMKRRAKDEAKRAEDVCLKADIYRQFCIAECERIGA